MEWIKWKETNKNFICKLSMVVLKLQKYEKIASQDEPGWNNKHACPLKTFPPYSFLPSSHLSGSFALRSWFAIYSMFTTLPVQLSISIPHWLLIFIAVSWFISFLSSVNCLSYFTFIIAFSGAKAFY